MLRIDITVEKTDGNSGHTLGTEGRPCCTYRILVEGGKDGTSMVEALGDTVAEMARYQGRWLGEAQIVECWTGLPRNLQHVAEALGGEESGRRTFALDDRICCHRRPMDHQAQLLGCDPRLRKDAPCRLQKADGRIRRGGGDLRNAHRPARLIEEQSVCEGSADVDA